MELKTCRFCGASAIRCGADYGIIFPDKMAHSVQCKRCTNTTAWHDSEEKAANEWNGVDDRWLMHS